MTENFWTLKFLEYLLESGDVFDIADFIENKSDIVPTREQSLAMANEVLEDLEHVTFTIN